MVMEWERIEPWDYIVAHVADEYHRKFTMVAREDIKQSLYEWFVSHPRKLTEWEGFSKKSAQNLLYITAADYHGFNPEHDDYGNPRAYGSQRAGTPIYKTVSFGVNIDF